MTGSGLPAGLTNPYGNGFVLTRNAAQVDALYPTRRGDDEQARALGNVEQAEESANLFETRDVVDLSKSAGGSQLTDDEQKQIEQLVALAQQPDLSIEDGDEAPIDSPIKRTGNHDFGERASDAAAFGIANALEQFAKPKGREGAPGQLKRVIETPIAEIAPKAEDSSQLRPDAIAGDLLDLVA